MATGAPYGSLQSPAKAPGVFQRATLSCQSTTAVGSNGDPPVGAGCCACPHRREQRAEGNKTVSGIAQGTICTHIGHARKGCSQDTSNPLLPLCSHPESKLNGGWAWPGLSKMPLHPFPSLNLPCRSFGYEMLLLVSCECCPLKRF